MGTLTCIGRDGKSRTFEYTVSQNICGDEWCYMVRSKSLPESSESFELTVKSISDSEVQVIAMYNNGEQEYREKGIPDALIPLISSELKKSVCSSPSRSGGNVYRTPAATNVWDRLKNKGLAAYSEEEDVYRLNKQLAVVPLQG